MIDQLEELFTQTVDEDERRAFLRMMVELATRPAGAVRLVATLRADYFDRPLGYPGFGDAIRGRTVVLGAMTASELGRRGAACPAAAVGVEIEPALVERIAAEAELQPGALPLVQHTMAELFGRRETNTITLAGFDETGGLAGAIGRRAESDLRAVRRARPGGRPAGVPPPRQRERGPRGHPPPGAPDRAGAEPASPPTTSRPCSASTGAIACSPSTAIRRAGRRPSSWPTRRCSPSGSGTGAGSTKLATTC